MAYDKMYRKFMESMNKEFYVETSKLYSSIEKIQEVVEGLNNKKFSYSKGKPILVSKINDDKYFVVDGNHRVMENMNAGLTRIRVALFDYREDSTESDLAKTAVPMLDYIDLLDRDIDEARVPKTVPRYLYHATYKQMIPTLKKQGGLKVGSFLSTSFKEALNDAEMVEGLDQDWKDNIVVYKVNTGKLNHKKLEVDDKENPYEYTYNGVVPFDCLVKNG